MNSREYPEAGNTRLHNAILARDNNTALELIDSIPAEEINKKSLGNTPLMLALKTANFTVARAILKRDDVEVVPNTMKDLASDSRGISPLNLACAWRENDIIQCILDKYKTHIIKVFEVDFDISNLFSPDKLAANLFEIQRGFCLQKLPGANPFIKKFIEQRSDAKIYVDNYSREAIHGDIKSREYYNRIIDSNKLILDHAPELTDALLFHSRSICLNLGLLTENDFKQYPSSQHQFAHNLSIGFAAILDYRNKKPVDEKLAATLGHQSAVNAENQPPIHKM